jgi:HlyD family secretion protein
LEFVHIEPYVIPKVSLTGASTERVDTRVLQVIFSMNRPDEPPLYVGQQVDVFIEATAP